MGQFTKIEPVDHKERLYLKLHIITHYYIVMRTHTCTTSTRGGSLKEQPSALALCLSGLGSVQPLPKAAQHSGPGPGGWVLESRCPGSRASSTTSLVGDLVRSASPAFTNQVVHLKTCTFPKRTEPNNKMFARGPPGT